MSKGPKMKTPTQQTPDPPQVFVDACEPALHLLRAEMIGLATLLPPLMMPGGLQHGSAAGVDATDEDAAFDNMPV
jgi:hypothetical protein